ncbi:heat shock 70 kDa protein 12A-like [Saccostrea cucullata]|uniref:heat shock 70 kDa protein 12A-like n=1 Tax=Saccostrea cuccullata TaxID=36930 RepID=UPI002ED14AAD
MNLTVFEVLSNGQIKEKYSTTGRDWDGSFLFKEFYKFLEELFGEDTMQSFKSKEPTEFLEMRKDFDIQSRFIDTSRKTVSFRLPPSLFEMVDAIRKETVQDLIKSVARMYNSRISCYGNKLKVCASMCTNFFHPVKHSIYSNLRRVLTHPGVQQVDLVLLVGGFSESAFLIDAIKKEFRNHRITTPENPMLSVLIGAAIYGHDPSIIRQNIAKLTYGCVEVYNEQRFSAKEIPLSSGKFDRLIEIGQTLKIGRTQLFRKYKPDPGSKSISIYFYGSKMANPNYVNDKGCFYLGSVALKFPKHEKEIGEIRLEVAFTGSAINASLINISSGYTEKSSINTSFKASPGDYLIVGAMDFGTTYSGYAFSTKHNYLDDPATIHKRTWTATSGQLQSLKVPTCALFTPKKKFHSFGYEAEDEFVSLSENDEHKDWYFFRRFKMKLYKKVTITDDFLLKSSDNKTLPAVLVFSSIIRYLRNEMLNDVHFINLNIHSYALRWVITVPAIWTDASKSFMRKCAFQAGIEDEKLVIALEPEAAALYSNLVSIKDQVGEIKMVNGMKYLVCDAGGGTVDITVHQMIDNTGHLRELYKASGGDWGGTKVDEEMEIFYEKVVGKEVMDKFKEEYPEDALELSREFETKKRSFSSTTDKVSFNLPESLLTVYEEYTEMSLSNDAIITSGLEKYAKISEERIRINGDYFRTFYDNSISQIVGHLKEIFEDPNLNDVGLILLVGGYAESFILQDALVSSFPQKRLLVPKEAGLSVLKGAVIFGHNPSLITERKAKYTYGVKCRILFIDKIHREDYKIFDEGEMWCRNVFHRHVTIGDTLVVGKNQSAKTYTKSKYSRSVKVEVYASLKKNPMYTTDEGCFYLGGKSLKFEDQNALSASEIEVKMSFSGTEIEVTMIYKATGRITKLYLEHDKQ